METLKYIYHDCFVYGSSQMNVIFDYRADPWGGDRFLDEIDTALPLYVVVSHHHKDHFTPRIFDWARRFPKIHFILSKDTARAVNYILKPNSTYLGPHRVDRSKVSVLRPGEVFEDENLRIEAYGSTDIGNSYMLRTPRGRNIFHAGDLNAWVWKDESTPAEIKAAIRDFEAILARIVPRRIDLAMFPVDARLGRDYWEGAYRFLRKFQVGMFISMHFALQTGLDECARFAAAATDFSRYANPQYGWYGAMTVPYETILLH